MIPPPLPKETPPLELTVSIGRFHVKLRFLVSFEKITKKKLSPECPPEGWPGSSISR